MENNDHQLRLLKEVSRLTAERDKYRNTLIVLDLGLQQIIGLRPIHNTLEQAQSKAEDLKQRVRQVLAET